MKTNNKISTTTIQKDRIQALHMNKFAMSIQCINIIHRNKFIPLKNVKITRNSLVVARETKTLIQTEAMQT